MPFQSILDSAWVCVLNDENFLPDKRFVLDMYRTDVESHIVWMRVRLMWAKNRVACVESPHFDLCMRRVWIDEHVHNAVGYLLCEHIWIRICERICKRTEIWRGNLRNKPRLFSMFYAYNRFIYFGEIRCFAIFNQLYCFLGQSTVIS